MLYEVITTEAADAGFAPHRHQDGVEPDLDPFAAMIADQQLAPVFDPNLLGGVAGQHPDPLRLA